MAETERRTVMDKQQERDEMKACLMKYMGPDWDAELSEHTVRIFSDNQFWRGWRARAEIANTTDPKTEKGEKDA